MNSNENPVPHGLWAEPARSANPGRFPLFRMVSRAAKPPVREDSLKSGAVQIERKNFIFALKENPGAACSASRRTLTGGSIPSSSPPPA